MLATAIVHTAFIYISTVGQSVHGITFVAQTLKTTRGVHTRVITCALEEAFVYILTGAFVCQQLKAFSAVALKAADGVLAGVIAATVVDLAFINIFARFPIWLKREADGAAAAHAGGCVFAGAVAAAIVHGASFH